MSKRMVHRPSIPSVNVDLNLTLLTLINPEKQLENGMSEMVSTGERKYDFEGRKEYQKRISNGFRLFGKYYQALWD